MVKGSPFKFTKLVANTLFIRLLSIIPLTIVAIAFDLPTEALVIMGVITDVFVLAGYAAPKLIVLINEVNDGEKDNTDTKK